MDEFPDSVPWLLILMLEPTEVVLPGHRPILISSIIPLYIRYPLCY